MRGRHGYIEDYECLVQLKNYRGVVASALRGKRGQRFLRELIAALDALPEKRLITEELERRERADARADKTNDAEKGSPGVCAIGAVGLMRGIDMTKLDTSNTEELGDVFDIAHQLAAEVMYENDEHHDKTPEARWTRMRAWAVGELRPSEDWFTTPVETIEEP